MRIAYSLTRGDGVNLALDCSSCGPIAPSVYPDPLDELVSMALRHHRSEHNGHVAMIALDPGLPVSRRVPLRAARQAPGARP